MSKNIVSMSRRPLAAALFVALIAPGMAFAETAKEKELEARVAALERQIQALLSSQQQQQTVIADTQAQITEVKTAQAAPADGKPRIQTGPIMPGANPGTSFTYGGFIKMDGMYTDTSDGRIADGSSGRLFYLPSSIPVGGPTANGGDPYTDYHAQFSRFWFSADHTTDKG
ncbi:MAG TPA: hypothetical protein VET30_01360, partial [Pseudoxanthomonas sp.]|nr:hypothetical protein [Pseudoxanthomonas sp.]